MKAILHDYFMNIQSKIGLILPSCFQEKHSQMNFGQIILNLGIFDESTKLQVSQ
jgi:hypothetical protein